MQIAFTARGFKNEARIPSVRSRALLLQVVFLAVCFLAVVAGALAQDATSSDAVRTFVAVTRLSPPSYPPLARQAAIWGEVKVELHIRKDGSVESAEVVSGHAMLKQAALESAQKSQFECRGCGQEPVLYSLTYSFEIKDYGDCCSTPPRTPEVAQSPGRIVIVAPKVCICDPGPGMTKVCSAKCLYLWKCGARSLRVE